MELKNCPECGRLYTYINVNLCPDCRKQDEEDFKNVKDFLAEHPRIGVFELAEATGVDEVKIVRWVRERRIEGKQFPGLSIPCESCGKPIFQGRYCQKCSDELVKGFTSATQQEDDDIFDPHRPKFHTKYKY